MKKIFLLTSIAVTFLISACTPTITQQHPDDIVVQQHLPPETWITHETSNFSLALPPSWKVFDEGILEAEADELDDIFTSSFDFTFFAMDLANTSSFHTSVNLAEEYLPLEISLEEYVALSAQGLQYFADVQGDVTHQILDLPSGQAGYFCYISKVPVGQRSKNIALIQYLFKQKQLYYILSFANPVELQDVYAPIFKKIVQTVSVSPTPSPQAFPESPLSLGNPNPFSPFYLASFMR
ncbi:MAG: hypothetical protein ACRCYY_03435 [Trueperaceae bacterium]